MLRQALTATCGVALLLGATACSGDGGTVSAPPAGTAAEATSGTAPSRTTGVTSSAAARTLDETRLRSALLVQADLPSGWSVLGRSSHTTIDVNPGPPSGERNCSAPTTVHHERTALALGTYVPPLPKGADSGTNHVFSLVQQFRSAADAQTVLEREAWRNATCPSEDHPDQHARRLADPGRGDASAAVRHTLRHNGRDVIEDYLFARVGSVVVVVIGTMDAGDPAQPAGVVLDKQVAKVRSARG